MKDKASTDEIFSVRDNLGIARWQSQFTAIESGKRNALDCLFLVVFDEDEKCSCFANGGILKQWMPMNDQ